jgi:hypothetical protein
MNDDTRRLIYGTIVAFLVFIVAWLGLVYISACGFTLNCVQGAPLVVRTPIPTLIPFSELQAQPEATAATAVPVEFNQCRVAATDLIGAWVTAGHPETEPFPFTDLDGQNCEGTFADIEPLFIENSLWFPGSLGCTSCHNADLTERSAGLDLTSYEAMSQGKDIFGGDNWENSLLHDVLVNRGLTTEGHSPDVEPPQTIIYTGQVVAEGEGTATPAATATP